MLNMQASMGPAHILRPPFGSDLLKELEGFVRAAGINLAWLSGLGAVSRATIRYFEEPKQQWIDIELDKRLEVASLLGNVSLMNGEPILHVHIALCDEEGCYGGHLGYNTLAINVEMLVTTLSGPAVTRKLDAQTGLTIWH
jgi:predicted DNA-binding protein with PD1-like motif